MQLNQAQKEYFRALWRRIGANYLREARERRQKIDVSAFVKLKTSGMVGFYRVQRVFDFLK